MQNVGRFVDTVLCAVFLSVTIGHAQVPQGTAFTYQGELLHNNAPVNNNVDMVFDLFDAASGGNALGPSLAFTAGNGNPVAVDRGIFTVTLDFGALAFNTVVSDERYLRITVAGNALSPRTKIENGPYSLQARSAELAYSVSDASIGTQQIVPTQVQRRVTGTCAAGLAIRAVAQDGAVTCQSVGSGTITQVTAGTGMAGGGSSGSVSLGIAPGGVGSTELASGSVGATKIDASTVQVRVTDTCSAGHAISSIAPSGGVTCQIVGTGTITGVTAGTGLTGGGSSGSVSLGIAPGGVGLAQIDSNAVQSRVSGTCPAGQYISAVTANGSVTCQNDAIGTPAGSTWNLSGNLGTGANFLGTTDNSPLVFKVNGTQVGKLVPTSNPSFPDAPNVVFGAPTNNATYIGATIAGGGSTAATCGAGGVQSCANTANGGFAAIGGGYNNTAAGSQSTIAGGNSNTITPSGGISTIGGGHDNAVSNFESVIAGGSTNSASGFESAIGGGVANTASGDQTTVSGGYINTASGKGAAVGGGESNHATNQDTVVGGGNLNLANGTAATVAGGSVNTASGNESTVGGGSHNSASALEATIGGGGSNSATGNGSTIGGGSSNVASGVSSSVTGGVSNTASGTYSVVAGGFGSQAGGDISFTGGRNAKVRDSSPGGANNAGACSPGTNCGDAGTFIWSGAVLSSFASTGSNQFLVRANGGVGLNTALAMNGGPLRDELTIAAAPDLPQGSNNVDFTFENSSAVATHSGFTFVAEPAGYFSLFEQNWDGTTLHYAPLMRFAYNFNNSFPHADVMFSTSTSLGILTVGNAGDSSSGNGAHLTNAGVWTNASSRSFKEDFIPIDVTDVLRKVVSLPVQTWFYKGAHGEGRHMGPVAEDFAAAFGLGGGDDQHIGTVDEEGVALAAIQGLDTKLEAENARLSRENAELRARIERIEARIDRAEPP